MLEHDKDPLAEGSGTMLFQTLKSLLMLIPQSTSFNILQDRLVSTSRFRQSVISVRPVDQHEGGLSEETEMFVDRVLDVRRIHCEALWETIRLESLETPNVEMKEQEPRIREEGADRREWLGYASKEEERVAQARYREDKRRRQDPGVSIEELRPGYNDFESSGVDAVQLPILEPNTDEPQESWKDFWTDSNTQP